MSEMLLLANIVLQSGFCVGHISFQVAAHHGHLVEAVAERVLRRVQALLRGCQILVREVLGSHGNCTIVLRDAMDVRHMRGAHCSGSSNSTIKRVDCLVCVTRDLGLGLLKERKRKRERERERETASTGGQAGNPPNPARGTLLVSQDGLCETH